MVIDNTRLFRLLIQTLKLNLGHFKLDRHLRSPPELIQNCGNIMNDRRMMNDERKDCGKIFYLSILEVFFGNSTMIVVGTKHLFF